MQLRAAARYSRQRNLQSIRGVPPQCCLVCENVPAKCWRAAVKAGVEKVALAERLDASKRDAAVLGLVTM